MLKHILLFLKGFAMGLANVIPGVSGGTVAFLTGIFERLIKALKSFDATAVKLLFGRRFKEFAKHTDLLFLIVLFSGVGASIFSLAKLLEILFAKYEIHVWAYFFGLILASVYYVGKTIEKINFSAILSFIIGCAVAVSLCVVTPATENSNFFYLILCGAVGCASMILPGLSGSFVLILMGNYELIMISAVSHLDFMILIPVAIGVLFGLIVFSRALGYLFDKFKNQTIALLTGFVLGSLGFIWPWKHKGILLNDGQIFYLNNGNLPMEIEAIEKFDSHGNPIIAGYDRYLPDFTPETFIAIALIILGIVTLCVIEELSKRKNKNNEEIDNQEII